jgi:hypothetical protein|tara:strand:+ start:622 stop:888 length:267 start_codon:yes stop_codon:yes gene_type:complete
MTEQTWRNNPRKSYMFFEEVTLPTESFGICKTYYECVGDGSKLHTGDKLVLAEGVCCDCWDKGLGGLPTSYMKQKRKKSNRGVKRALL